MDRLGPVKDDLDQAEFNEHVLRSLDELETDMEILQIRTGANEVVAKIFGGTMVICSLIYLAGEILKAVLLS